MARWREEAARVAAQLLERGLDPSGSWFVGRYGATHADASVLTVPLSGILPAEDPRVGRTIDFVRERLADGPYLRRYAIDDGVGGPEGAFVLCGFWLAEALAMAGRLEEAHDVFEEHAEHASNHLGLLAEEVDPTTRDPLGNFPQAFSHLGLINAACRIDRALRLRDEGRFDAPHLVGPDRGHRPSR